MAEETFDLVPILIGLLVLVFVKELYFMYKRSTRIHHETYFVMMGNPECCTMNDLNSNRICTKYCMRKLLLGILDRISTAKRSICIAMYNFTNYKIADSLLQAHRRGIKIRLVTDKSTCRNKENRTQAKRLKDAGEFNNHFDADIMKLSFS